MDNVVASGIGSEEEQSRESKCDVLGWVDF